MQHLIEQLGEAVAQALPSPSASHDGPLYVSGVQFHFGDGSEEGDLTRCFVVGHSDIDDQAWTALLAAAEGDYDSRYDKPAGDPAFPISQTGRVPLTEMLRDGRVGARLYRYEPHIVRAAEYMYGTLGKVIQFGEALTWLRENFQGRTVTLQDVHDAAGAPALMEVPWKRHVRVLGDMLNPAFDVTVDLSF